MPAPMATPRRALRPRRPTFSIRLAAGCVAVEPAAATLLMPASAGAAASVANESAVAVIAAIANDLVMALNSRFPGKEEYRPAATTHSLVAGDRHLLPALKITTYGTCQSEPEPRMNRFSASTTLSSFKTNNRIVTAFRRECDAAVAVLGVRRRPRSPCNCANRVDDQPSRQRPWLLRHVVNCIPSHTIQALSAVRGPVPRAILMPAWH